MNGVPAEWNQLSYADKYSCARKHVLQIDQHLPFNTFRVKEIISEINPEIVVHEFITKDMDEFTGKLNVQRNNLK
jgi:hypothetical protein